MSEKGAYIEACEVTTDEAMKTARDGIAIHIVNDLIAANEELKAKLEIAIKALEFYADESNWLPHPDWHQDFELINDDSDTFMNDMNENNDDVIGGRRARQALKEIKE